MVDESSPTEFVRQTPPEVVREAVGKVHRSYLKTRESQDRKLGIKLSLDELFEEATRGKCLYMSYAVAHLLAESHADKFSEMMILMTHDIPESSPVYDNVDQGSYHSYFLLKSKDGVWFAGSPANHNMRIGSGRDDSYAATIFEDKSLKKVLERVKSRDKCDYPSAMEVKKEIAQYEKSFGLDEDVLEIVEIKRAKGETFSTMNRTRF